MMLARGTYEHGKFSVNEKTDNPSSLDFGNSPEEIMIENYTMTVYWIVHYLFPGVFENVCRELPNLDGAFGSLPRCICVV